MQISSLIKQKSYEKVEYVLRRHWVTFTPVLLLFVFLILVPPALSAMTNNLFPGFLFQPNVYPAIILSGAVFYLSILLFFFAQFIDFYLDEWIITNDRILDIEQFGLFSRNISELDLFRIQDVTTDVKGFFGTIFKYGNLHVKTASQNTQIIFRKIPNPNIIRQELLRLSHSDRKYNYPQPTKAENPE